MEEAKKYLYGASVQGIQDFIFQTNKLVEIAGASELVEQICFEAFKEYVKDEKEKDANWIVRAAGKIIYIFENKENCEKAVLKFPRKVMKMAPGITISQSVVFIKGDLSDYGKQSDELEKKLREQRNKAIRSQTLGLMAIKRAPSTGLPAVEEVRKEYGDGNEKELIDEASVSKKDMRDSIELAKKAFGEGITQKEITNEIDRIAGKNNWIAVIHADGNGLGNIVQKVGKDAKKMKDFSSELDKITKESARSAFDEVKKNYFKGDIIPIRPVVLGGDDLTMICKADFAVEYTKIFLEAFEEESEKRLKNKLTACAGIAYVKSSYPFHYAVDLAKQLCKRAKKKTKEIDKDRIWLLLV
jgi:CRISPR/Cas system-associated protein Cas10 (large subunit of type III CRISPR-Cas system)